MRVCSTRGSRSRPVRRTPVASHDPYDCGRGWDHHEEPLHDQGRWSGQDPERPIATIEQVFALADAIDRPYRIAVLLATFAGLRVGEILALTRERFDFEANSVVVVEQLQELKRGGYLVGPPKSDAGSRLVSLPDFMMEELSRHLAAVRGAGPQGRLFEGAKGGPLRRAVLQRAWDEARVKVGMEHLHFHDLRHTGNTLAAATGASTGSSWLGWAMPAPKPPCATSTRRERDQAIAPASAPWRQADRTDVRESEPAVAATKSRR